MNDSKIVYRMDASIDSEGSQISFIDTGIHDNLELTEIKYEVSKNGNEFLAFSVKDENGKTLSHTEWKPTDVDPKVLQDKSHNQMKRLKHIVTKFVPENEYVFDFSSFEELAKKTISILGDKYKGKKVRGKVVYNEKNFTTFPKYVPFIESMDVPKEKSGLSVLSIDKMTKSNNGSYIPSNKNEFEDAPVATEKSDDLPF